MKRRDFLRNAVCSSLACASGSALFSQLGMLSSAMAQTCSYPPVDDYRALVCIFLFGGNDSFNLLIPSDTQRYAVYNTSRSGPAPNGMAIDRNSLIGINALGVPGGNAYGVHPSCQGLATLFNSGNGAFVVNTGTLIKPTTKTDYLTPGYNVPPLLFSHADQQGQWQYGQAAENGSVGWGGLSADRLYMLNSGNIPMSISLGGQNRFQTGVQVQPYAVTGAGPTQLNLSSGAMSTLQDLLHQTYPDPLTRTYASTVSNALNYYETMQTALGGATDVSQYFSAFADNPIAGALQEIARIISVNKGLGAKRQIFFVGYGSFDTHQNQLDDQPDLLQTVSDAMGAFYKAVDQGLSMSDSVTTFTMSEFARTLNSNDSGTDHAWAGIQFVAGGAVKGQKLYGQACASGGIFPDQTLNGPDCLERGQMIPSVSCDQYAATLATWLGVQPCDIDAIFPNVHQFTNPQTGNWNLGFMKT